jgi:xylose isomerase
MRRIRAAGIDGIEFHNTVFLDDHYQRDGEVIASVKSLLKELRLTPTCMNMMLWHEHRWKFGSITHPDPGIRRQATEIALQAVDLAVEVGCSSVNLWPGSDGWDYHFEVDYGQRLSWFIDGCTEIAEKCRAAKLPYGTESKQKEPREGNMIVNTVAKAALVASEVNRTLGSSAMGVAIDYGHEQMVGNTPADSLYMLKRLGIPIANFHVNGAKFNSNDEDRIAGTDDIWRLVEFCYAAIDTEYQGWFGEDQFTYRTEQVESMRLSREFFANCMKKALLIYARKADLAKAQMSGDAGQTIQTVKRIIYNG